MYIIWYPYNTYIVNGYLVQKCLTYYSKKIYNKRANIVNGVKHKNKFYIHREKKLMSLKKVNGLNFKK